MNTVETINHLASQHVGRNIRFEFLDFPDRPSIRITRLEYNICVIYYFENSNIWRHRTQRDKGWECDALGNITSDVSSKVQIGKLGNPEIFEYLIDDWLHTDCISARAHKKMRRAFRSIT